MTRRSFLQKSSYASVATGCSLNMLTQLRLLTASANAQTTPFNDYKALVCVFLSGGNDAFNSVHPIGAPSAGNLREQYENVRGDLKLFNGVPPGSPAGTPSEAGIAINSPTPQTAAFQRFYGGTVSPLGLHYNMPGMAQMFNEQDMSVVLNVGSLVEPLVSRADFFDALKRKPVQLFSHNDQRQQWLTALSQEVSLRSGWGGRLAELINSSANPAGKVSMTIALNGTTAFQVGDTSNVLQYVVNEGGPASVVGFSNSAGPYGAASNPGSTFDSPSYSGTEQARRLEALERIVKKSNQSLFNDEHSKIFARARRNEAVILEANAVASAAIDAAFTGLNTSIANQLRQVAKLIAGRDIIGNKRQIFFVNTGGYDTHSGSLPGHAALMQSLSAAMTAFRAALKLPAVNAWDKTVAFTGSDFGRSLSANGNDRDSVGSDHAWSGNSFIMGGPVQGGRLFGDFPPLRLDSGSGSMDIGRGRLIPTLSVEQYSSSLATWFGADSNSLDVIFPNLANFSAHPNLALF